MFMVRMRAELPDALKSVLSARIFDGAAGATQSRILINLTTKPQAGISAD